MIKKKYANKARLRRHQRLRRHLAGVTARPRLNVFRSGVHIYAQVIDDTTGQTLVSASSLDASLRDFKPEPVVKREESATEAGSEEQVVVAQEAPAKGKGAKAEKAPKGRQSAAAAKTILPAAQKSARKTPVEALVAISNNRKVALAREVGKLVARRAQEKGVTQVVFDRGGYAYHGRVAALAEGAREVGLGF